MPPAMHPVKNKINAEQQKDKRPPIQFNRKNAEVFPKKAVSVKNSDHHQDIGRLIAELGAEIGDCFCESDVFAFEYKTSRNLHTDKQ